MNDTGKAPAFPTEDFMGLTIRDYFAAKVLQALVGLSDTPIPLDEVEGPAGDAARLAYIVADQMLIAREAKK